jgi:cytochrome c
MKPIATLTVAACALAPMLFWSLPAPAAAPDAVAITAGCSACHAKDKKILGPSYHDIAAKYKADASAATALAAKVRSGGKGVWGPVPMPAADAKKISDADLHAVIDWILKQ